MPFMIPHVTDEPFVRVHDKYEETLVPAEQASEYAWFRREVLNADVDCEPAEPGWYCQLTAPGYLDSTDWSGPFEDEIEARVDLQRTHGVCGLCGTELSDSLSRCPLCPSPHRDISYFDRVAGAYWYYAEHHHGQFSDEYRVLSRLCANYRPAPRHNGVEDAGEDAWRFYLYLALRTA